MSLSINRLRRILGQRRAQPAQPANQPRTAPRPRTALSRQACRQGLPHRIAFDSVSDPDPQDDESPDGSPDESPYGLWALPTNPKIGSQYDHRGTSPFG
jgi:hypothetical protein